MRLGIMQPYFMPYIGYFQLMKLVDVFVIYDNIQYVKKGWINRNRFLQSGRDVYFSIPLKKNSDYSNVCDRNLAESFDREKLINQVQAAYRKAPFFDEVFPFFVSILNNKEQNLFQFIYDSILKIANKLLIDTKIIISSTLEIDHNLRSEDKVIEICKNLDADIYINSIGGQNLYNKNRFRENNIELQFIKTNNIVYPQFGSDFIPFLSIVDVMMFNSLNDINLMLDDFSLVEE